MTMRSLHQFISAKRDAILTRCIEKIQTRAPQRTNEDLAVDFGAAIDEIMHALESGTGVPASPPLPHAPSAMKYGAEQQSRGYAIENLALDFGTISDTIGELATAQNLRFSAHDYHVFNVWLDNAISAALEQFSKRARQQQDDAASQRMGFLAHELRNALGSARMAFAVLKQGKVGVASKTGDILDRNLRRLESLVGQTLLAVRMNAGVQLQPKRMSVGALLRDAQESAVIERGIRIVVDMATEVEIEGDETLLVSAIGNLLQNAIKFTKSSGRVTLRAGRDGETVIMEVEDQCGGLPSDDHEALFAPFVTQGGARRGLGLGLAITRQAIEAHGGEISVRNLPGAGCIFAMRLPARRPGPDADPPFAPKENKAR